MNINFSNIVKIANKNNTPIFSGDYNPNIWGVRSIDQRAGKFDDILLVFETDTNKNVTKSMTFSVTCDPSDLSLMNFKNKYGCAIIKYGFHKGMWQFGFHKQDKSHPALVQKNAITVVRDFNKDNILDSAPITSNMLYRKIEKPDGIVEYVDDKNNIIRREQTGIFGINCHRASAWRMLESVGLYSEGCVVHQDPNRYMKEFIPYIDICSRIANSFSFTLISETQLNDIV